MNLQKQIKKEIQEMEDLMWEFKDFGAADTEPDWQFQNTLRLAIQGKRGVIWPTNSDEWELYTLSLSCEKAAWQMTDQVKKIVDLIREVPVGQVNSIRDMLIKHCWRVDF